MRDLMLEYIDLISDAAKGLGCERTSPIFTRCSEWERAQTGNSRSTKKQAI